MKNIAPEQFIAQSDYGLIIDVRTPLEFSAGHIVGAVNIPLFTDEQRATVGTIYKKQSKQKAVEAGLDFVGVRLGDFVRNIKKELKVKKMSPETTLYLYCWRGGMRSNSMAWLFRTAGYNVEVLMGGYKAYRASFIEKLNSNYWKYLILGGPTGCGKTYILAELEKLGEQVIDLEGMASHRGSAFGNYGHELAQPTSEHFSNILYNKLLKLSPEIPIWCEGESMSIGKVFMPQELYDTIQNSEFLHFNMPKELRLSHIMKDYGDCPKEELTRCFENITKRLGYDNAKNAIEMIENGDIRSAATIALEYYDKSYNHSINSRARKFEHVIFAEEDNAHNTAKILIEKRIYIYE